MTESDKKFVNALKSELKFIRYQNEKFPKTEQMFKNLIKKYENS